MAFKVLLYTVVLVAAANAGYLGAPALYGGHPGYASPAITSQSSNILRSYGNLGQVATHTKTIDTPFSSVSKSDVRVSNPGYAVGVGYAGYPAHGLGYAPALRPALPAVAAGHGLLGVAYSPATAVSHMTYHAPALGLTYAY